MSFAVINASSWLWYFGRATGMVAMVLLSAIVVLGILGPLQVSSDRWPRFAIRTIHRDTALLAMVVIVLHVLAMVLDGYVSIPLISAILPGASSYDPFWTGLGAVALDLLLAIIATSLLRNRLGFRTWRLVHWFAYISWPVAIAHGIGEGSDSSSVWGLALTVTCIVTVAGAVAARLQIGTAAKALEA